MLLLPKYKSVVFTKYITQNSDQGTDKIGF